MKFRWFARLAISVVPILLFSTCDDFNRPLKETIDFYLSITPVDSWKSLNDAVRSVSGHGTIALAESFETGSAAIPIHDKTITLIALDGDREIKRAEGFTEAFFVVGSGGKLILDSPERSENEGTLILDGVKVDAADALIRVNDDGSLIMNSGILRNNSNRVSAPGNGGGVYVSSSGSFIMNGGTISRNSVSLYGASGGGVYVNSSGSFTMSGGIISNNTAPNGDGGGVFTGSFTMSGGTISGNSSAYSGGGVFTMSSFTMTGGTISGNRSNANTSSGAGVYASSFFVMSDGTIHGNTVFGGGGNGSDSSGGGGVYASGSFIMSGGTISGNTVRPNYSSGGGVKVGSFTMSGGTIHGNTTSQGSGGGVQADSFTMTGGTISGNSITGDSYNGGGVSAQSSFKKIGGTIYGNNESDASIKNTATGGGHAVYFDGDGKKRDITAGPEDDLDSGYSGALPGGGWEAP